MLVSANIQATQLALNTRAPYFSQVKDSAPHAIRAHTRNINTMNQYVCLVNA